MKGFAGAYPNRLYRSRDGMILGVCRGVADYFDISVFWTRVITLFFLLISGLWPIMGIYFVAALLMKPRPVIPIHTNDEQEFYDSYTYSANSAARRLKRRYENLEHRLQRLEHTVTTPEYDWDRRLNT